MAGWGLPYQGSKGAHAGKIYRAIKQRHPEADTLVEPFCGGFAVGHFFAAHGWNVIASDVEPYVVALLQRLLAGEVFDGGDNEHIATRWVSREQFFAAVRTPKETGLPDWAIGLIRVVWSFGNSQTSYIYGKPLEAAKRAGHMLAVEGKTSTDMEFGVPMVMQKKIAQLRTRKARRMALRRVTAELVKRTKRSSPLALQHLEYLDRIAQLKSAERQERVEAIARTMKGSAQVLHRGYLDAFKDATPESVVYCDPPYAGTDGYASTGGQFNNAEFWKAAEKIAEAGIPVYVTEYTAPPGWVSILSFSRPDAAAASVAKRNYAREHLFTYRPKD